jgi:hypothetical protein
LSIEVREMVETLNRVVGDYPSGWGRDDGI